MKLEVALDGFKAGGIREEILYNIQSKYEPSDVVSLKGN